MKITPESKPINIEPPKKIEDPKKKDDELSEITKKIEKIDLSEPKN